MCFDPKLLHDTYTICFFPCACNQCTLILDKPWSPCVPPHQRPHYQPVTYFTYYPFLGSFESWNTVKFSHKKTYSKDIDKINQVVLDSISDNMATLV